MKTGRILAFTLFWTLTIFTSATVLEAAMQAPKPRAQVSDVWYGMYTDATSYAPGDTINVYASSPNVNTVFRLVRLDAGWNEFTRTEIINVGPQVSRVGSFIEFPGLTLAGRSNFTLEGWFHPTLLGGDTTVIAGQFGESQAAAAIMVLSDTGKIAAYVSSVTATITAPSQYAIAPAPASFNDWLDSWHHLAMTYNGAKVKLYVDGVEVAQRNQTGAVAPGLTSTVPFRLGARAEAPGDLTGVIDGRIDSWAVWPAALNATQVFSRYTRGLTEGNPVPQNLNNVDLYVAFEDAYPAVTDSSHNNYSAVVVNHGNPGVAGVLTDTGKAFRLNHDQIVDAGWSLTAQLTVPPNLDSGMYAVQALYSPYTSTTVGGRLTARAIAIRPAITATRASIAVVLPTNTWLAYNRWPGTYGAYLAGSGITRRGRFPGGPTKSGGNNSAYNPMGDNMSLAYYHGLQRPSTEMSPIPTIADPQDSIVRAPGSMYLVQWLDEQGFDYDVYSDEDFDAGVISATNYKVIMPNAHHEYWTDGMLDALTQFLDAGGSVVAPAGNMFGWRTVRNDNHLIEVRKYRRTLAVGTADFFSGIDGKLMGGWNSEAICNSGHEYYGELDYQALGTRSHLVHPCSNQPGCYGQWQAQNTNHWLWQGSSLKDLDLFGTGRLTDTYAVGHEADTWVSGMPLPGLAADQQPVILAEGTNFNQPGTGDPGDVTDLLNTVGVTKTVPTCEQLTAALVGTQTYTGGADIPPTKAGTILYFQHTGGGDVLVIGASATPWALASDSVLSGLLYRALDCFALGNRCGYQIYLPLILKE